MGADEGLGPAGDEDGLGSAGAGAGGCALASAVIFSAAAFAMAAAFAASLLGERDQTGIGAPIVPMRVAATSFGTAGGFEDGPLALDAPPVSSDS